MIPPPWIIEELERLRRERERDERPRPPPERPARREDDAPPPHIDPAAPIVIEFVAARAHRR